MSKSNAQPKGFLLGSSHRRRREEGVVADQRKPVETTSVPADTDFSFNTNEASSNANSSKKSYHFKWADSDKFHPSSSSNESPGRIINSLNNKARSKHSQGHSNNGTFDSDQCQADCTTKSDPFAENITDSYEKASTLIRRNKGHVHLDQKSAFLGAEVEAEMRGKDIDTEMTLLENSRRLSILLHSSTDFQNPNPQQLGNGESNAMDVSTLNWGSREQEEEDSSKSLRHIDVGAWRKSTGDCRACLWEEAEDKSKFCGRHQREEAKIQAWVNLQNAKAEAQTRKLEVKIQMMRSKHEEKLTKRMTQVHKKVEGLRAAAQVQQSQQMVKASNTSQNVDIQDSFQEENSPPCGCFH